MSIDNNESLLKSIESTIINIENILKNNNIVRNSSNTNMHESNETNEINTALAKSQVEYPQIYLNRRDKGLNNIYTDLDNIMTLIRPILGANGISLTQRTLQSDSKSFLQTRIWHSSGQWIETVERFKPEANNITSYNSELNEVRKSQIVSLLNITINNDVLDDNGFNASSEEYSNFKNPVNKEFNYDPRKESFKTITSDQFKDIKIELAFIPGLEERLLKKLSLSSFADLSDSMFDTTKALIIANKNAYINENKR